MIRSIYWQTRWSFFWNHFQLPEFELSSLVPDPQKKIEPTIIEKLCLPPYQGPVDHDDISPLLSFIGYSRPKYVLELGTAYGSTAANICLICDTKIYTVNALEEQIQGDIITFVLTKDDIGSIYRKHEFGDRITQIYENTQEMNPLDYIEPGTIDIVIIDACHDMDYVINDFLMIQPVIHTGSAVFFHDVHPSRQGHLADSYLACMYLRKMGYNIRHLENTWWGVWINGLSDDNQNRLIRMGNTVDHAITKLRKRNYLEDAINFRYYYRFSSGLNNKG